MSSAAARNRKTSSDMVVPRAISNDDDCTEESPEPSPMALPQHLSSIGSKSRRLTSASNKMWTTPGNNLSIDSEGDNESIPTVPDMPSPYSPPPASLFSGEEWARRTVRKVRPPREVRTSSPTLESINVESLGNLDDEDYDSTDESLEQVLSHVLKTSPDPSQFTVDSSKRRKSTILPAVMHLKKNLEDSHQSLFMLRQENKALAAECDNFQKQLDEWQDTSSREKLVLEQEKNEIHQRVQKLTESNETLTKERDHLQSKVASLEQLEEKIKDVARARDELQAEIENMQLEQKELASIAKQEGDGKKLLESELLAARAQKSAMQKEHADLVQKLESTEKEVAEMRLKLKSQTIASSEKLQLTKQELQNEAQALKKENTSFKLEIDRLKAMLKESEKKSGRDSQETLALVADLQKELTELRASLQKSNGKANELRAQKTALRKELAEKNRPTQDGSCQTEVAQVRALGTQTEHCGAREISIQTDACLLENAVPLLQDVTGTKIKSGNSITMRLGRIREAAERAAFVQDYRRELEKLSRDHEQELNQMEKNHQESLREVLQQAKNEVHDRVKGYKQRLKDDFDAKVARLEKNHTAELKRMRKELDATKGSADEKIKLAAIELSSTSDRLSREISMRKKLEQTVQDLEKRIASEEQIALSLESKQQEWEARTRDILDGIQRECNALFDTRKPMAGISTSNVHSILRKSSETMPLTLGDRVGLGPSKISFDLGDLQPPTQSSAAPVNTSLISNSSQIDRALEETEALVLSLVGNDFRVL